jgi:PhnB protein
MAAKPIPDGFHTVTPALVVDGAAKLIDFLKAVFGAEELRRMRGPGNTVMHAEVRIGDSIVMLGDAAHEPRMPGRLYVYLRDVDAAYRRALEAGATSLTEPTDMFYGDRAARVRDPFGNVWGIATHVEDVPAEELARRAAAAGQG